VIITVAPGINTLSAAVSAMRNGDVIQMIDGIYIQNEGVVIPNGVIRFNIEGKGSAVTKIIYNTNVNGIRSNLSSLAFRINQCKISGFEMIYESTNPGTGCAIGILGSSYNDTRDTSIILDDIRIVYGTYGNCWGTGIRLINARVSALDRITTRFSPSGRLGIGVDLQSCTNVKMTQMFLMSNDIALNLVKAPDILISDAIKHGCEDICIDHSTTHISRIGMNLGYKCFMAKITNCEIEYCTQKGIYEDISFGAENGGYHFLDNNYIGSSYGIGDAIWLRRPGTSVTGNNIFGSGYPQNGIRVDMGLNVISGNLIRNLESGSTGILILGSDNNITNNAFEGSGPLNVDIYIYNSAARGNFIAGNMIDTQIVNNGTGTILGQNPVH